MSFIALYTIIAPVMQLPMFSLRGKQQEYLKELVCLLISNITGQLSRYLQLIPESIDFSYLVETQNCVKIDKF